VRCFRRTSSDRCSRLSTSHISSEAKMQMSKIKVKFGEHEFEAEGPTELVQAQFQTFSDLVCSPTPALSLVPRSDRASTVATQETAEVCPDGLGKVLRVQGRIVWLTAPSSTPEEAALLVMLGQCDMRNNLSSTGQEIHDGLERSGHWVRRVDRLLVGLVKSRLLVTSGSGRAMRYCLTSQGVQKARALARHLAWEESANSWT